MKRKQMKRKLKQLMGILLSLAMVLGIMQGMSSTAHAFSYVSYVYYTVSGTTAEQHTDGSCTSYTALTNDTSGIGYGQWYVVSEDVTAFNRINVSGTANLILCDGKTLTASKGFRLSSGATLNIYAQEGGTGTLIATATTGNAGIGSNSYGSGSMAINIHGGIINTTGGDSASGLGGGQDADAGTVTIYGGSVTAQGGSQGAGIGKSGSGWPQNISIYGGTVNAYAGTGGSIGIWGNQVSIYDGDVIANGSGGFNGIAGALTLGDEVGMLISPDNNTWSVYDPVLNDRKQYMKTGLLEDSGTGTPSGSGTSGSQTELLSKLYAAGNTGDAVTVEYESDVALSCDSMQYLKDHPLVTLVLHMSYDGEEFTVTIPGSDAIVDPAIKWYGPLWLKAHYGTEAAKNAATATTTTVSPKTGDNGIPTFPVLIVALAGCAVATGCMAYRKKKQS